MSLNIKKTTTTKAVSMGSSILTEGMCTAEYMQKFINEFDPIKDTYENRDLIAQKAKIEADLFMRKKEDEAIFGTYEQRSNAKATMSCVSSVAGSQLNMRANWGIDDSTSYGPLGSAYVTQESLEVIVHRAMRDVESKAKRREEDFEKMMRHDLAAFLKKEFDSQIELIRKELAEKNLDWEKVKSFELKY
jgi:hypothetical protein